VLRTSCWPTKVSRQDARRPGGRAWSRKAIFEQADASLTRLGPILRTLYRSIASIRTARRGDDGGPARHRPKLAGPLPGRSIQCKPGNSRSSSIAGSAGWTRFVASRTSSVNRSAPEERELLPMCADRAWA